MTFLKLVSAVAVFERAI